MPGKLPKLPSLPKLGKLPKMPSLSKAKKPSPNTRVFDSDNEPSPLEQQTEAELSEILAGFKARAKQEQARFEEATDSFHYTTIVFQTRAQVEAFLKAIGQEPDQMFVDGMEVALRLGIEIPEARVTGKLGRVERELAQMSLES